MIPGKYSASFFVNTDLENNQIASFYTGAMGDASSLSLHEIKKGEADYLMISPNDPLAMKKYVEECIELGLPYLLTRPSRWRAIARRPAPRRAERAQPSSVTNMNSNCCRNTRNCVPKTWKAAWRCWWSQGRVRRQREIRRQGISIPIVPRKIADPPVWERFPRGLFTRLPPGLDLQTCGQMGPWLPPIAWNDKARKTIFTHPLNLSKDTVSTLMIKVPWMF